jgi:hypothetical protein
MKHGLEGLEQVWPTFASTQGDRGHLFFHPWRDEKLTPLKHSGQIVDESVLSLLSKVNKTIRINDPNGTHDRCGALSNHHVCASAS